MILESGKQATIAIMSKLEQPGLLIELTEAKAKLGLFV